MRRTRIKRPRKYRMQTKKKFKMNRYQNCREIDPMIPSNPNELSDIEKCADNIEAIDGASIDETNPSLYYALTEPSRPDINPQCITKQNYINLPIKISKRRSGDCSSCYANPKKANKLLKWHAKYDLYEMCESAWKFASNN